MSTLFRKTIPLSLIIILFFAQMADFVYGDEWWHENIFNGLNEFNTVMGTIAGGIGFILLMRVHLGNIYDELKKKVKVRRAYRWFDSLIIVIPTILLVIVGLFTSEGVNHRFYNFYMMSFNLPMETIASGIVIYFMVSSFYRVLRVRTYQVGILTVVFLLVAAGTSPLITTYLPFLADLSNWISAVPLVGLERTIGTVGFLGMIFIIYRVLTGQEKSVFGG